MYAKVENGTVKKAGARPQWFNDHGEPLTDTELAQHGWLPVTSAPPDHDTLTERVARDPQDQWLVGESTVTVTHTVTPLTAVEQDEAWAAAVARKKQEIDRERDARLRNSTVTVNGHEFDTRQDTIARFTGAAVKAVADPGFTVDWITEANHIVTLDADGILAVGDALAAREADLVFKARHLKDMVDGITTRSQASLDAISWDEAAP